MGLNFNDTSCCALQEIDGLRQYVNNSVGAMFDFCEKNLTTRVVFKGDLGRDKTLYSFYLFSAGLPKETGNDDNYGEQFAAFIRKEALGELWESPVKRNSAFHSYSFNRIWVWSPNMAALKKWYAEELKTRPKPTQGIEGHQAAGKPKPKVAVGPGRWDTALGIAGERMYACPGCDCTHQHNTPVYNTYDGKWWCKLCAEKGVVK